MTQRKELPGGRPGRAAQVAAIHALAQWFVEHPEAPMPTFVDASYYVNDQDEVDEPTRVASILSIARRLDLNPIEGKSTVQATRTITDPHVHGIRIQYTVAAMKDHVAPKKYL